MSANSKEQRRLLWMIFAATLLLGLLMSVLNLVPHSSKASSPKSNVSEVSAPAFKLTSDDTPLKPPDDQPSYLWGTHNAVKVGALGPHHRVKVPRAVKARIVSYARKHPKLHRKLKKLGFWRTQVWLAGCVPVVGINQIAHHRYVKCLTPHQQSVRFKKLIHVSLGCGQTAIVTTFFGGWAGAKKDIGKKGAVVGAIGGAVGCSVDQEIKQAKQDLKSQWSGPTATHTARRVWGIRPFKHLPNF